MTPPKTPPASKAKSAHSRNARPGPLCSRPKRRVAATQPRASLNGSPEEQLLGEAGEQGQRQRLRRGERAEDAGEPRLELPRQREQALGSPPEGQEQKAGRRSQAEIEPPPAHVDEQRQRDDPALETDPDGSGERQDEVETPGETIELPRRRGELGLRFQAEPRTRRSSCPSSSSRRESGPGPCR